MKTIKVDKVILYYMDRVECEEPRFRGDAGCITWCKATVDEIIEHFKNR